MKIHSITFKLIKLLYRTLSNPFHWCVTRLLFFLNDLRIPNDFKTFGIPYVSISLKGKATIGKRFFMHSGFYNVIGRQQKVILIVIHTGVLEIKNNVGISSSAIICQNKITIEDNVLIGGNVVIYDTDFHDLDYKNRTSIPEITTGVRTAPVHIHKNVFIGAHSTILKGVEIGENSIIGAGSVVSGRVPSNEVWGGNPARFIRKLSPSDTM